MSQAPASAAQLGVDNVCDVLVIGGGPAGSAAATLLARQGRDVLLIEKAHHPRFHIGESLLPASGRLFEALGVREAVERIGMRKWGVEFVSPQHAHTGQIEFADAADPSLNYAWQVRRSELDELLFRHAAASGARTREGCQADKVDFDAEGATVQTRCEGGSRRQWRTRFVVDATGRDTLLARQQGSRRKDPLHDSAALYAHFRGAERLPGKLEGNISIFWFEHGWFWFIPLADGHTSVGAVCWPQYLKTRRKPLPDFFRDTIALCPPLAKRLAPAELLADTVEATGNYSYSAERASGERHVLLGDAYAFVDPVFSSGVHLALRSAFASADLIAARLDRPHEAAAAQRRFEHLAQRGPREFTWFIHRMGSPVIRDMFMNPRSLFGAKKALMALLAGDIDHADHAGLRVFKGAYGMLSLLDAKQSWRHRRQRQTRLAEAAQ
ncbi:MAG: tryptophan 7-halogenase [Pseudomonadota bacterium]|nr:tryptophan 7-halogenase [Pseudomonadota bacterium]